MKSTGNARLHNAQIRPRPTKASGVAMIVTGIIFMAFGALPFTVAEGESRFFVMMFGVVWVLACLSFVIYGIYILTSAKPSAGMVYDVETGSAAANAEAGADFDVRLRKLEMLKQDKLISEEEYQKKRTEILKESW
jgi:hypothetical protein